MGDRLINILYPEQDLHVCMYVCIAAVFIVLGNLYFHHKLGVFRCVHANSEYAHKPVLYHAQRLGARKNDVPHSLPYIRSTSLRV